MLSIVSSQPGDNARPFHTVDSLVRQLRLNEKTVRQLLQRGELRGFKIGSQWRVDPDDLDAWLNSQRETQPRSA